MTAKKKLLTLLAMKEHMQGDDILQAFKNLMDKTTSSHCGNCVQY